MTIHAHDPRSRGGQWPRFRHALALALFCLWGLTQAASTDWVENEATRDTMQVIFENLRLLLQIDMSDGDFDSPRYRGEVLEALRELDDQSAILASHGFYEDSAGAFLAGVLERYSLLLLRTYERGDTEQMGQLLYGMTDICIACHTRLPSPHDSPVAKQFAESKAVWALPEKKRARVQVATRRFDDALITLELLIESSRVANPVVLEDLLRTYLVVNIRVKGDMERPVATLESVEERSAPGSSWRRDVEIWLRSLQYFRNTPFIVDPLRSARDVIDWTTGVDFPSHRSALVDYIAASSLLHRYLASTPSDVMGVSEAHYLLGLAEYRIYPDDWLPQAELFLELAIVLAPDAPWAKPAYSLLVEKIHRTYLQSPGGRLPLEVEERLEELKQAIDGDQPTSASVHIRPSERLTGGLRTAGKSSRQKFDPGHLGYRTPM
jgi:hypothetical protein